MPKLGVSIWEEVGRLLFKGPQKSWNKQYTEAGWEPGSVHSDAELQLS